MAFYLVRAELIVSAPDFDPCVLTDQAEIFKRAWRVGDLVRPNGKVTFKDSGVRFSLLDDIEEPEWLELVTSSLRDWISKFERTLDLIPTPLISVCVRTGGSDFPPIYFSREFLGLVEKMRAKIDVDVIATAALEKQEEDDEGGDSKKSGA